MAGADPHPSVLRRLTTGDLEVLLPMQREGSEVGLAIVFPQDKFPFPTESVRRRWEQEFADPSVDCFAVVDANDSLAGFVALRGGELFHFGTALGTWGSGLAGRAHDEVLARWTAQGFRRAWLRVFEENLRARRFYERRGWEPTGDRTRSGFAPCPVLLTYAIGLAPDCDNA